MPLIFKEDDLVDVSGTTIVDKGFHGSLFLCKIKDTGGRRWTKDNAFSLNLWNRWQVKCIKRSGDVANFYWSVLKSVLGSVTLAFLIFKTFMFFKVV